MMIAFRGLLLFGFLALLSGCTTPTCPRPSYPSYTGYNCLYQMTVTNIDTTTGWVQGKYTNDLVDKGGADPKVEFKFLVRDLDWLVSKNLLVKGHDYFFVNGGGSPFLEPFPEGYGIESPSYLPWAGK